MRLPICKGPVGEGANRPARTGSAESDSVRSEGAKTDANGRGLAVHLLFFDLVQRLAVHALSSGGACF